MDVDQATAEQLLRHAERQTKALESLNTYVTRLIAVLAVLLLIAVIAWLS